MWRRVLYIGLGPGHEAFYGNTGGERVSQLLQPPARLGARQFLAAYRRQPSPRLYRRLALRRGDDGRGGGASTRTTRAILLPVFLRRLPPRILVGGTAYQYGLFIEPRGAGGALRVARHVRQRGASVVRRVACALSSLLDQNHARFAGAMEHGPAFTERLVKKLIKPSLRASMAWD